MAQLQPMPALDISTETLQLYGSKWREEVRNERGRVTKQAGALSRTAPQSSSQFGAYFDSRIGHALSVMLGGIETVTPRSTSLLPRKPDCVEVGNVRIVGGVRPQNFDVGYRPDGVRFVSDTKTLNDRKSVAKNYQNMINDLATEATTVHSRFPYALVAFLVVVPEPCLVQPQRAALVGTLERLAGRRAVDEPLHMAEAVSLIVWDPTTGAISTSVPDSASVLRYERFSEAVEEIYYSRYKGLPPHAEVGREAEEADEETPGEPGAEEEPGLAAVSPS